MKAKLCCRISSRRQAHSLLSVMRVPSIFVKGSGSFASALSEPTAGMGPTVHPTPGSSTLPHSPTTSLPPPPLPVAPPDWPLLPPLAAAPPLAAPPAPKLLPPVENPPPVPSPEPPTPKPLPPVPTVGEPPLPSYSPGTPLQPSAAKGTEERRASEESERVRRRRINVHSQRAAN